jgi:chemotaxis methyl-accepting protein methylase
MDKTVYAELCAVLFEHTGAQISVVKNSSKRNIEKYAHTRGFATAKAYLAYLRENIDQEMPNLADHGLVHLTSFGRNHVFWEALQRHFICQIKPEDNVRVLSLGCSDGHELTTIALLLHQFTSEKNITIDALDIAPKCIKNAMNLAFPKKHLNKLTFLTPRVWKSLVELPPGNRLRLIPELAARIHARVADVRTRTGDWWGAEPAVYDLVLCRNLLLYLEASVAEDTMIEISKVLKPRGLMGIGAIDPKPPHKLFRELAFMLYLKVGKEGLGAAPNIQSSRL